jgi:hypothetical protein
MVLVFKLDVMDLLIIVVVCFRVLVVLVVKVVLMVNLLVQGLVVPVEKRHAV